MMTDDELKALVANLALSQAKTDAQIAELRTSQAKTDAALQTFVANLEASHARLEASQAKTDAKLDRVCQQLADIGYGNGDAAEDFFYNALEEDMRLGDIRFDYIDRNLHRHKKRLEDEYDIFMGNGKAVALIEVKHRVSPMHITTLVTRKIKNFRALYPLYGKHKIYTGIAGMSFAARAVEEAKAAGVVVLRQKGQRLEMHAKQMRAY